jgi:hypothetical protein
MKKSAEKIFTEKIHRILEGTLFTPFLCTMILSLESNKPWHIFFVHPAPRQSRREDEDCGHFNSSSRARPSYIIQINTSRT